MDDDIFIKIRTIEEVAFDCGMKRGGFRCVLKKFNIQNQN